jgi:ABC-type lipoprotein export system ATPase subunit
MLLDENMLTDHLSGGLQQSVAMFRASILKYPQIVSFI